MKPSDWAGLIILIIMLLLGAATLFLVFLMWLPDILESWDEAKAALEERKERKRKEG